MCGATNNLFNFVPIVRNFACVWEREREREREGDRWIVVPRQTERERLACVVRRQSNLVALVPPAFGKDESRRMKLSHF